jgi:hypothetical protein
LYCIEHNRREKTELYCIEHNRREKTELYCIEHNRREKTELYCIEQNRSISESRRLKYCLSWRYTPIDQSKSENRKEKSEFEV